MIFFRWLLILLISCVVLLIVDQYFFCPQFSFAKPKPFSGDHLYNPYANVDSACWLKCNFHAHDRSWYGLTNGKGDASDIWHIYDSLGYSVHCVSNYEKINRFNKDLVNFIPTYEHGYGLRKNHQLVLGSNHILWRDYLFPQTLSNKQNLLNLLQNDSIVLSINHPCVRNAYPPADFAYLNNYNCVEVLNGACESLTQWDSALSAGKPVFILGDDDVHDLFNSKLVGKFCTWVNVPAISEKNVLTSLRSGNEYGMIIGSRDRKPAPGKNEQFRNDLPVMKAETLKGDTFTVEVTEPAQDIRFMGQDGRMLAEFGNCSKASYIIQPADTYVRTTIYYHDETQLFLNPIFRYDQSIYNVSPPVINLTTTIIYRVTGCVILLLYALFIFRKVFRKKPVARLNLS